MFGAQSLLHLTGSTWRRDDGVRGVAWAKGAGQLLTGEKLEVLVDRQDARFHVEFVQRSRRVTAGDHAHGGVVRTLDVIDCRGGGVGRPDGGSVIE